MFLCVHPARLSPRPSVSVGGVAVGNFHETIDIAKPCLHSILVGIQCTQVRINMFEQLHLFSAGSALFWSWVCIRALYLVTVVT